MVVTHLIRKTNIVFFSLKIKNGEMKVVKGDGKDIGRKAVSFGNVPATFLTTLFPNNEKLTIKNE